MGINVVDLQINPRILAAARRAGLHDGDTVLSLSGAEIERMTKLASGDVAQLKDAVVQAVLQHQKVKTALKMWVDGHSNDATHTPKLSTGCEKLDRALRGGLLTGGLTEIVGESASGKTQLCLQLCLHVQLPFKYGGLNGGAIYICTEGAFPSRRLNQMAQSISRQYQSVTKHCFTDFILLEHVADLEGLENVIKKKLGVVLGGGRVKLVVVDSIAALFRCHYDASNMSGRAKHIAALATQLRQLADRYGAVVVCINQVTANMSKVCDSGEPPRQSVPALGLVWADHVTCRLLMSRPNSGGEHFAVNTDEDCVSQKGDTTQDDKTVTSRSKAVKAGDSTAGVEASGDSGVVSSDLGLVTKRRLEVVFAPHLPNTTVSLVISSAGVSSDGNSSERFHPVVHYTHRT